MRKIEIFFFNFKKSKKKTLKSFLKIIATKLKETQVFQKKKLTEQSQNQICIILF